MKLCLHCSKPIDPANPNHRKMKYCSLPCFADSLRKTPEEAFWSKVNKDAAGGCWLWTAAKERHGYGHFRHAHKDYRAHRYAYELASGPIPKGMEIMHVCDVKACVNPDHLQPATRLENMGDLKAKRLHVYGERSHNAVVTEEQVRKIRAEYRRENFSKSNAKELGARYGVTAEAILHIVARRTWSYVK